MTLLPCPFCGGEADYLPERLMAIGAEPPVFCDGCHASALDADAWNRRAPGYTAGAEAMREAAARLANRRWRDWPGVHPDDAQPSQVCDDVSACADIAAVIRALPLPEEPGGAGNV